MRILSALLLALALVGCQAVPTATPVVDAKLQASRLAFTTLSGKVIQLLPDDLKGSRHQHFLFESAGRTYKVAHNIDLAPYVPLKAGDAVTIKGELIKEKPYAILHWTHWDPRGGDGGFILFQGKKYEKI